MKRAPDYQDNLYQPPASQLQPFEPVLEGRTVNGSYIRVGTRKKFTGAFNVVATVVLLALLFLHITAGICGLSLLERFDSPVLVAGGLIAGLVLTYFLLIPWYSGIAIGELVMKPKDFHAQTDFVVGLRFKPRLTINPAERLDSDDDTGVVSVTPGALEYRGDRIEMRFSRGDAFAVRRERASAMKLGLVGPDVVVAFQEPILRCREMKLVINEGRTPWHAIRRARQMARAMEQWLQAGPSAPAAPQL